MQNAPATLALIGIGFALMHVGYELSRIADALATVGARP